MKDYKDIIGDGGSKIIEQVTENFVLLSERTKDIKYKMAVMSGKGGVGKSTITAGLAVGLAINGYRVGILDADLNGPSIPKIIGVEDVSIELSEDGVAPPAGPLGIKVMSIGLFLTSKGMPTTWDGPSATYPWISTIEATALRELIADTNWGDLDFLFIDMPPVLSRLNDLTGLLPGLNGVVIVTIPSEMSYLLVLKSINKARELNVPIIGIIENMKGYTCVHCRKENSLFTEDDGENLFAYLGIHYLGRVPFDNNLQALSTAGLTNYLKEGQNLPLSEAIISIMEKVLRRIG